MSRSKAYKSDVKAALHETATDLHEAGLIDKKTMRGFDESCLTPAAPLTPHEIRALREREHVSQTVFANYLNVTPNLVSQWERGEKKPSGAVAVTELPRDGLPGIMNGLESTVHHLIGPGCQGAETPE